MAKQRLLTIFAVTILLSACGPPVVDTSSSDDLVRSVAEIRSSLDEEQRMRFDDAFGELTDGAMLAGNPESLHSEVDSCAAVSGLSANEIIRQAWQTRVARTHDRISKLEARRDRSVEARSLLTRLEVLEAKLYPAAEGFLEESVVEIELNNRTRRRIFQITFQVSLRLPGQLEPLVVELVDRPFGAGLAPGKQVRVRVELEDPEWRRQSRAAAEGTFACCVLALEGRRKSTIARTDFGAIEQYLLEALGRRLAELEAKQPPG